MRSSDSAYDIVTSHAQSVQISEQVCMIICGTANKNKPFGGISVIFLIDFGQLPPVGDRALYVYENGSIISAHRHSLYRLLNTVVILDDIMRQPGSNPEAIAFRSLLMRMRDGRITEGRLASSPSTFTHKC